MTRWRYIAQRATSGRFLDYELPLITDGPEWALSAAGSLVGKLTPAIGNRPAEDGRPVVEEWGTFLYAEADGQIRWGGIVVSSEVGADGLLSVEAASFASYPHGVPFGGSIERIQADPADLIREVWADLQQHPDGNLGVVVTGSTPVRIGTEPREVQFETGDGEQVAFDAGPYRLDWWDTPDAGSEINSLAAEGLADYTEHHAWRANGTISHEIRIQHPRAGRRRDDLAFIEGENVSAVVTAKRDGDDYANEVVALGAGEGAGALRRTAAVRDGRLRRPAVIAAKDVSAASRLESLTRAELSFRQAATRVDEITVRDHPHAPIGSWQLGDDVRIQATLPHYGEVDQWCRVVAWQLVGEHSARLSLERSDL